MNYDPNSSMNRYQAINPSRFVSLTTYLTLFSAAIGGILSIQRILDRWEVAGLLVIFGVLYNRYPHRDPYRDQKPAYLILFIQTILITILMQYSDASLLFAILFFITSVIAGLNFPLRISLLWILGFAIIVAASLARFYGWNFAIQFTMPYTGGYLFFGLVANTLQRLQIAQQVNEKLLGDLQAKNKQLEEYSDQVESLTIIEERNRIAREMHDTIGHRLTVAAVQLEGAQRLILNNPEKTSKIILTVREQVREALNELRRTVGRLHEPVELEFSFPQSIRRLTVSFQEATQLKINLNLSEHILDMNHDLHLVLYRMVQEALTNVHRHANATEVWIHMKNESNHLILSIKDNGIGFLPENLSEGFGLKGMRDRAAKIGGSLHIKSSPGHGTEIILSAPYR
jgi:signal transduction histidine kinase